MLLRYHVYVREDVKLFIKIFFILESIPYIWDEGQVFPDKEMKETEDNLIEDLEKIGLYRVYRMAPVAKRLGSRPFDKTAPGESIGDAVITRKELDTIATAMGDLGLDIADIYSDGVVARRKLDVHGWEKYYRYHLHPTGVWKGGYSIKDTSGITDIVMISMNPDEFLTAAVWDISEDSALAESLGGRKHNWHLK